MPVNTPSACLPGGVLAQVGDRRAGSRRRRPPCRPRTRRRRPRPPPRWCPRRCRRRPRCAAAGGRTATRRARLPHLRQHLGHELLAAEAGLDRHHQQRVEVGQQVQVRLEGRARLDRQPGQARRPRAGRGPAGPGRRPPRRGTVTLCGAGLRVRRGPPVRVVDHQVAVERQRRSPRRRPRTTGRPMVRLGTKWLSMTSTCSQSAPRTARRPRRAGRSRPSSRLGAIIGGTRCQPYRRRPDRSPAAQQRQNIASVPCRCGHSWTVGPVPEVGHAGGSSGRASSSSTVPLGEHVGDAPSVGLDQVRRAGHVGDHAAGPDRAQRGPQQLALQPGQRRQVGRAGAASAPPAGGAASPARCTGRRPAPGRSASAGSFGVAADRRGRRPAARSTGRPPWPRWRPGRPGARRTSTAVSRRRRAGAASAPSRPALPPGPAHRSSQRSSGPSSGAAAQRERAPAGCPRPARGPGRPGRRPARPGAAAGQLDRVRRERARRSPPASVGQLVAVEPAGPGAQVHLRPARCRRPAPAAVSARSPPSASANARRSTRGWRARPPGGRPGRRRPAPPRRARRPSPVSATRRSTALAKPAARARPSGPGRRSWTTAACDGTRVCSSW